jgi:beta-1,4-galactosyltransferase 2
MEQHKLGIVVPYRNREEHANKFIPFMNDYLNTRNISFKIYIVDQEEGKPFNRAKLLNVGFLEADKDIDYFVFHDVDMLPDGIDYSYCDAPTHLACSASQFDFSLPYQGYFGGVTLFPRTTFELINGFSNEYWGWGAEDDDILHRCRLSNIMPDRKCSGTIESLKHERKIQHNDYVKNIERINQMWRGEIDWKNDGLNSCIYTIIDKNENSQRTWIKVSI